MSLYSRSKNPISLLCFAQILGHLLDDLLLFNEENIHDLLTHSLVAQDTAMSPGEQSLKWFR